MCVADREHWGQGDIGQAVIGQHRPEQIARRIRAGKLFTHVKVQHRAAGIFALQFVLQFQRLERIVGMIDRDLRAVGVIDVLTAPSLNDVGKAFAVFLGKAIVEIAGLFLIPDQPCPHVIEDGKRHGDPVPLGKVRSVASEVAHHFVHPINPDGRKMVAKKRKVACGIGVEPAIIHLLHKRPFFLQR